MNRRLIYAIFFVVVLVPHLVASESEPLTASKAADIKKLMQVSGAAEISMLFCNQMVDYVINDTRSLQPDIPEELFVILQEELMQLVHREMWTPGGLMDRMVPIWDKYLSHQEIRELIKFYETPLGKKLVTEMPAMHREGRLTGEKWGEEISPA